MTFAIGYARQSLGRAGEDEDTSLSLDAQEHAIRSYCDRQGWRVEEVLRDHDLKGNDPTRPGIKKLLAAVKPEAMVVVFALSRLARDNILQETIYRQIKVKGGTLVSVSEPHAENDLVRGIMGVINEEERRKQGRMVAIAAEQRFRRGQPHGAAPYGYRKENFSFEPEEPEASIVREIFTRVAAGESARQVMMDLNARGVPTATNAPRWASPVFYRLIRNPVYAGGLHFNKEVSWPDEGEQWHEPLVSRAIFDAAQEQTNNRKRHRPNLKPDGDPYEGMVRHECGLSAYLRVAGKRVDGNAYAQFTCSSIDRHGACAIASRSISRIKIDRAVPELLTRDLGELPNADTMLATAIAAHDAAAPGVMARQEELLGQISAIDARVKRAESLWLDGMRSIEWFRGHEAEAKEERARLFAELETLPAALNLDAVRRRIAVLLKAQQQLSHLSREAIAQLLREIGSIQFGPGGICIVYDPLIAPIIPHPAVIPNLGRNDRRTSHTF